MAELFVEDLGCLPWNHYALTRYARAKGLSLTPGSGSIDPIHRAVRKARREKGLPAPAPPPPRAQRPDVQSVEPASTGHGPPARKNKVAWSARANIVDGLVAALDALAAEGESALSQRSLNRVAKGNPAIPNYAVVQRFAKAHETSFPELREVAARRRTRRN